MIGSIAKQFTAAAVLLLEEDGRLSTSDTIAGYFPSLQRGGDITIEQLLTHTAGIVDVFALDSFAETSGARGRFDDIVDEIAAATLVHEPGERFLYSNGGYLLLAAILERASGMPYGELLETMIFTPLGMTQTHHGNAEGRAEDRASGYLPKGLDRLEKAPLLAPAYLAGAGSLWSTAEDMLTWSEALHLGQLLSADSYAKLTADYGAGYGFGVSVFERLGRPVVGHDGRISGFASDLAWYVEDQLSIVVLSNVESVARDQVRVAAASATFDQPFRGPVPPAYEAPRMDLETIIGVYDFGPGLIVYVRQSDGRLLARANNGAESEMLYTDDGEWFSRMLYTRVCFETNAAGAAVAMRWGCADNGPTGARADR